MQQVLLPIINDIKDDLISVKEELTSLNKSVERICDKMDEHEDHPREHVVELLTDTPPVTQSHSLSVEASAVVYQTLYLFTLFLSLSPITKTISIRRSAVVETNEIYRWKVDNSRAFFMSD